jgi:curli biogenesis system outer membrane secretion channel CsgG
MKIKCLLFIFLIFGLSACVSRTINEEIIDSGPQVRSKSLPIESRINIAIARFTNESVYGSGLFTDKSGDRIGKQASDLLARHLMATHRFNIMERQDLGKLKTEAELMGRTEKQFKQNIKGVNALIVGSVVELGRDTTGSSWLVGKEKTQRVRAKVVVRLIDPVTSEVFHSQEGTGDATMSASSTLGFGGTAGFDSTLEGKAINAAIVNMINKIVATLNARHY